MTAVSARRPAGLRRIILLSIDDLRFDALSCESETCYLRRYGLDRLRATPVLDGIAATGVRIRQAIAAAPYTPSSHASMLTGRYPPRHGIRAFLRNGLPTSIATLAERLKSAGYRAVGAIDFHNLFDLSGLSRGFDQIIRADDRALWQALTICGEGRLFLFAHFGDVHPPYGESLSPPSPGYNDDAYDEEVRLARALSLSPHAGDVKSRADFIALSNAVRRYCEDRAIADTVQFPRYLRGVNKFDNGRLRYFIEGLRALGFLENALLVITSDHGQAPLPSWKRANRLIPQKFDHGEAVIEELIRVPLVFSAPGYLPSGRVLDAQVSLVDLVPTLLEYAGVRYALDDLDGVSLRGLLEDGGGSGRACAYSEAWYHDRSALSAFLKRSVAAGRILEEGYETFLFQRSLRTPEYKYVETGSDLTSDEMVLPDVVFARVAIQKILGHVVESGEVEGIIDALRRGRSRADLIAELRNRYLHRRALYDLNRDPFEEVNLLGAEAAWRALDGEARYAEVVGVLSQEMHEIDGRADVDASDPGETGADLDKVSEQLRLLGYID